MKAFFSKLLLPPCVVAPGPVPTNEKVSGFSEYTVLPNWAERGNGHSSSVVVLESAVANPRQGKRTHARNGTLIL